ncbi:MAG: diguanylate cyclase [Alphaproteobacteria bacterium]|nr:diguanylate cyclase [Alphaproteobacteria bacterium]
MKTIRFGLVVIAICALLVLAAGIRAAIWVHQIEAIAVDQELVSVQELILRETTEALLQIETTERSYLLTGDAAYLGRLDQSRQDLRAALARVDALIHDWAVRPEDVGELERLAAAAEAIALHAIDLRREGQQQAALDLALGDNAKQLAEDYRSRFSSVLDQIRQGRLRLDAQYTDTFRDLYILLAIVVLAVDLLIVVAIVTLSIAVQRLREQQREHEQVAMHDALTGLPNRRYLSEWLTMSLAAARRSGQRLVVLYFDLDGFKAVNDNLGHEAGDRVLQATAARLRRALRMSDFVARLGGDEFVAALPEAPTPAALAMLIERLQNEIMKAPIPELRDGAIRASIGTATFPADGETVDSLLSAADRAMYEIKQAGKQRRAALAAAREATPAATASAAE